MALSKKHHYILWLMDMQVFALPMAFILAKVARIGSGGCETRSWVATETDDCETTMVKQEITRNRRGFDSPQPTSFSLI